MPWVLRKSDNPGDFEAGRRDLGADLRDPGRDFEDFQDSGRISVGKSRIFNVLEGFGKDLRAAGIDFY